jgi:hypothetical protein
LGIERESLEPSLIYFISADGEMMEIGAILDGQEECVIPKTAF